VCGIYGIATYDTVIDHRLLIHHRDLLKHRGSDDAGMWLNGDKHIALGHRRLSIIDLSSAGHQPMLSKDGRYVIVFNGEIYNYLEIRQQLQQIGFVFNGSGDTEVILA
jgi:asparagine synthase (glutamine-hydrolysing)